MEVKELKVWEILVPQYLDGRELVPSHHYIWDNKVLELAGGLTLRTSVKGKWVSKDGELFPEEMLAVHVACSEEKLLEILEMTAEHYHQESVFAMLVSSKALIYEK